MRTTWEDDIVMKRKATIAARKADRGCDCHQLPMTQCPNYKPEIYSAREKYIAFTRRGWSSAR